MPSRLRPIDAALATLATIVVSAVGAGVVVGALGHESFDDAPVEALIAGQAVLWACLLGFPLLLSRRRGTGDPVRDLRLRTTWRDVPLGVGAGVATQIAVLVFLPLYDLVGIDPDKAGESAQDLADRADDPVAAALLVVMAVLMAGALEEVFYRGLWLRCLERLPQVAAVAISSVVFAVVHFDPYTFLPLVVVGAVAAVLTLRTDRIGPAVWMHMAFNGVSLAFLL